MGSGKWLLPVRHHLRARPGKNDLTRTLVRLSARRHMALALTIQIDLDTFFRGFFFGVVGVWLFIKALEAMGLGGD